jgi:ribonuclease HI
MSNHAQGTFTGTLIYTDGACSGNPGPGGYAAVIRRMDEGDEVSRLTVTGQRAATTNSRMEMMAAIAALDALGDAPGPVRIRSDSQLLVKGSTVWLAGWTKNGWRRADKKAVANADLWQRIADHMGARAITFEWVKGHADDPMNIEVDGLASAAARGEGWS